ncbi:MAG: 50S ribosomal protein L11 methyltransferase [Brumimicrobium sp.]|nr:50S ribosomal protein L11 methyltransferase [Brumimicrobium sp.]
MDYIELTLTVIPPNPWKDILIGELADIGFESFTEDDEKILNAYIQLELFSEKTTKDLIGNIQNKGADLTFSVKHIPSQNWNAEWESGFEPVEIDKKLLIKAPFHESVKGFEEVIEIQPQMSFGTGHHQTTYLLAKILIERDLSKLSVLDVGTGTGILGILCAKKGAKRVIGTDIETGACENALENIGRNNVKNFEILQVDISVVPNECFDVIIANINKNVLKKHLPEYALRSNPNTVLLLSGFFISDADELITEAKKAGFNHVDTHEKETWAVLEFKKI